MNDLKWVKFLTKNIPLLGLIFSAPKTIAQAVKQNRISWSTTTALLSALIGCSIYVQNRAADHLLHKQIEASPMAFFLLVYIFAFAGIVMFSVRPFGSSASYLKNLKLASLYLGVIFCFNAFLLIFDIDRIQTGSKVALVPALLVCSWSVIFWLAFADLNNVNGWWKKSLSFAVMGICTVILSVFLGVLSPYFINLVT